MAIVEKHVKHSCHKQFDNKLIMETNNGFAKICIETIILIIIFLNCTDFLLKTAGSYYSFVLYLLYQFFPIKISHRFKKKKKKKKKAQPPSP
jgi:hypothetical protein